MKRVLAAALCVAFLMISSLPIVSQDANAEVTYLVNENFTSGMGGWSDRLAYAGSSVVTLSEQYRHDGPCLAVNGNTDLRYVLGSPISTSTDLHVSFWIAIGTMPSNKVSTVFAAVYETSASIAGPRLTLGYGSSSYASLNNYPDGGSSYQVYQLTYGTWYHVELDSHNSNTEFDLTVNGVAVGTYQTYEGEPMFGDTITEFQIYSSNGSPYPNYYLDDYVVTTGSESGGENPPSGNAPVTFAHDPGARTITITPSAEVAEYTRGSVTSPRGASDFDEGTFEDGLIWGSLGAQSYGGDVAIDATQYHSSPNSLKLTSVQFGDAKIYAYPSDDDIVLASDPFTADLRVRYGSQFYSGNADREAVLRVNGQYCGLGLYSADGVTAEAYYFCNGATDTRTMTGKVLSLDTWYHITLIGTPGQLTISIDGTEYGPYDLNDEIAGTLQSLVVLPMDPPSGSRLIYVDDVSIEAQIAAEQPLAFAIKSYSGILSMITGLGSTASFDWSYRQGTLTGSHGTILMDWGLDAQGGLSTAYIEYGSALDIMVADTYDVIEGLTIAVMNVILGHPPGLEFSGYTSEYYSMSENIPGRTFTLVTAEEHKEDFWNTNTLGKFFDLLDSAIGFLVGTPYTMQDVYNGDTDTETLHFNGSRGNVALAVDLANETVFYTFDLSWTPSLDPYMADYYELWQALLTSHIHADVGGLSMPTWELAGGAGPEPWPPSWTSTPILTGLTDVAYTYTPQCNETVAFTIIAKPDWMSWDGITLTGTPTEAGSYPVIIKAIGPGTMPIWQNFSVVVVPPSWHQVSSWSARIISISILADFGFSGTSPIVYIGDPVSFTDTSIGSILSWSWDFGDGTTSTEQDPTHVYSKSGAFTVSLTVIGPYGRSTHSEIVTVWFAGRPIADFTASNTSQIGAPMETQFRFTGIAGFGTITYVWSFGDGSYSTSPNPVHIYDSAGSYDVSLTVTNSNGSSNVIKRSYIQINEPLFPSLAAPESLSIVILASIGIFLVAMAVILRRRR